jgi:hypothetical protein
VEISVTLLDPHRDRSGTPTATIPNTGNHPERPARRRPYVNLYLQLLPALADTLVDRGRAVLDQFPAVADSARDALAGAQDQVNGLSDMGIVAASGFALGVSSGLLLAGAPRAILILSMIPVALTLRSAFARGMRPARLIN